MAQRPYVAVIGPGDATPEEEQAAQEIGRGLGDGGAIVVCGGLGGVMAAACHGVAAAAGTSIGLLPGATRDHANQWAQIVLPTGLGELRNGLVIRSADAVIAVGGAHGTLSEIALALKTGVPVVGLNTWAIDGIDAVHTPNQAVQRALELARRAT
jgi:hypothetical protein